jgi:hypothetical protein
MIAAPTFGIRFNHLISDFPDGRIPGSTIADMIADKEIGGVIDVRAFQDLLGRDTPSDGV